MSPIFTESGLREASTESSTPTGFCTPATTSDSTSIDPSPVLRLDLPKRSMSGVGLDFGPDGVMYASIPKDGCYGVWWGILTVTLPHALFTPLAEFTSSQNKETWGIASQSSNPPPVIDPEPA
jgi:hypothetical protein